MSEWPIAQLAEVAEIRFSNVDKKTNVAERAVRLCNYMDVYGNGGYITADMDFMEASAMPTEAERFRVDRGDVLVTKDSETPDDIGIPAVVLDEIPNLVCGYHLALIKPCREKIDSIYLAKQLGSRPAASYFGKLANGSTRYGLSSNSIASFPFPLAPFEQQRRIAEILSTLDETIEQTEALIAKQQQIKAGLMHDLFTRGLAPDGHVRPPRDDAPHLYKKSSLGWIPNDWEVAKFGARIEVIDPNPSHRYPEAAPVGVPICSTENFANEDDFEFENAKLMPESVFVAQSLRCGFHSFDVIFARKGRIGLARRYGEERKVFSHTVVMFRPASSLVDKSWLLWISRSHWLLSGIDHEMNNNLGVPTLGIGLIQAVRVPFPSPEEQALVGEMLEQMSRSIAGEATHLAKLRQLKHGLMHDLLTGRVRVTMS